MKQANRVWLQLMSILIMLQASCVQVDAITSPTFTILVEASSIITPLAKTPIPVQTMTKSIASPVATIAPGMTSTSVPPTFPPIQNPKLSGHIYAFAYFYSILQPKYGLKEAIWLDLSERLSKNGEKKFILLASFSNFSNQVSILVAEEDFLEIWVSDLDINNPQLIWRGRDDTLGFDIDNDSYDLAWGPGDRSLLVYSLSANSHNIIEIQNKHVWRVSSDWEILIPLSFEMSGITIWYQIQQPQQTQYLSIDSTGEINFEESQPKNSAFRYRISGHNYLFSRDGKQLIVHDSTNKFVYIDNDGNLMKISDIEGPIYGSGLKWSLDGRFLLLWGASKMLCSQVYSTEYTPECWIIWDISTNAALWKPDRGEDVIEAAFSPDGHWLVYTSKVRVDEITTYVSNVIISLETGERYSILPNSDRITRLYWGQD